MATRPIDFWTGAITYGNESIEFGQVDSDGTSWIWNGYNREVDIDGGTDRRTGDHGSNPLPQFFTPATIEWRVTALAESQAARDRARYKLSKLIPINDLAVWRIDEDPVKYSYVRRSGPIKEEKWDRHHVLFNIGLVAPDPRLYSLMEYSSTASSNTIAASGVDIVTPFTLPITFPDRPTWTDAIVENDGNFQTPFIAYVYGPRSSPGLLNTNTGQSVSFTGLELREGDTLIVNFDTKTATLNNVYRTADITSSWWRCESGSTPIRVTGTSDTAPAVITWHSCWI